MGPRVPFAPSLLTLSLRITLHIYFLSFRLFILLYVTCVMVNKVVKKKSVGGTRIEFGSGKVRSACLNRA